MGWYFQNYYLFSYVRHGTIVIPLPKNLSNINDNIETVATMTYKGMYNLGTSQNIPIKYEKNNIINTSKSNPGNFKFTGNHGKQLININIDTILEEQINGSYLTQNPYDTGNFTLTKGSSDNLDTYSNNQNYDKCHIL